MNSQFSLKLDDKLKKQSFAVIESFGLTPSQAIRLILKQIADTGSLPISFEARNQMTPEAEARLRQSIKEFKEGDFEICHNLDELNQMIMAEKHD